MIELICVVVFSVGIVRDIPRQPFLKLHDGVAGGEVMHPFVVFPCAMSDREAYHYYAAHDPQIYGNRSMTDQEISEWRSTYQKEHAK